MLNLSIIALSLSNIYSNNPLFVGHNLMFQGLSYKNSFSTFIFNPENFDLNRCFFNKIQNSIVYKKEDSNFFRFRNSLVLEAIDALPTIQDQYFDQIQNFPSDPALIINNCIFEIITEEDIPVVSVSAVKPFYMVNCLFNGCKSKNSVIKLSVKATTITHTCIYNSQTENKYILHVDLPSQSFCKSFYSSFLGDQKCSSKAIIQYQNGYYQIKCMNFTNFNKTNEGIYINNPECLIFSMNTIVGFDVADFVLKQTCKWGKYGNYSFCNFYHNRYVNYLIIFDTSDKGNRDTNFYQCYFVDNFKLFEGKPFKPNIISSASKDGFLFQMINCYFQQSIVTDSEIFITINCNFFQNQEDFISINNKHHDTIYCKAVPHNQCYECAEIECPNALECDKNKFEFEENDATYDIIPTRDLYYATADFSSSNEFSFSNYFTSSFVFTESNKFSDSSVFTETLFFTHSHYFTETKTLKFGRTVIIDIKTDKNASGLSKGIKIGIGVCVAVVVIFSIFIGLFIFRKSKNKNKKIEIMDEESIEYIEDGGTSQITQNPLKNFMNDDDPFEEDFD